jgi:hypothetical protein
MNIMEKSTFGNKLANLGALNGITKKVSAAIEAATAEPKAKVAGFANDALVRTGAAGAAGGAIVTNAAQAAELRLANAYDPNPATFARNLAKASLQEMVSQLG